MGFLGFSLHVVYEFRLRAACRRSLWWSQGLVLHVVKEIRPRDAFRQSLSV